MPKEMLSVDEESIKGYIGDIVKNTVAEMINAALDAEADELVNAERYERTENVSALI